MALKKSQLYSSLWQSCDELRGGMDASQYKDYVLTMLFMKYVSDKYGGKEDSLIVVPEGGSFADMKKLKGDKEIGDKINKIIGRLAEANELKGVIDQADFNDENKLGRGREMTDRLSRLVAIFDGLDFRGNRAEGDDLLGDAYEYLMMHFATESGKSKGQFYTPAEVSRIMAQVIGIEHASALEQPTVYDPTCGSGSLLIKAADHSDKKNLAIFGQEMDNATLALARMNMILHGHPTAELKRGNTLAAPEFKNGKDLRTFDFAVANPPFSAKAWSNGLNPEKDVFGRFAYGVPPEKNGDFAFLLHLLKSLKSSGKGAIILPHGVLFRGNREADIRRELIQRGFIKGIIGLPANLFYGTGIPACIIVLDKEDAYRRQGIFMIDASKGFAKDGNKNRLRSQDIHKIVDIFNNLRELPGYARMVPVSEIASEANNYNLNIPRYIEAGEAEDLHDLQAHISGGIPTRDLDRLSAYWQVFPGLRAHLFRNNGRPGYAAPNFGGPQLRAAILEYAEFRAFAERVQAVFGAWRSAHAAMLAGLETGAAAKKIIHTLAEDLLARFAALPLLDRYEVYQRLMDYWAATMQDDVDLIAADGWRKAALPRPVIDDRAYNIREKPDWSIGRTKYKMDLLPPALIIARYLAAEQEALDAAEAAHESTKQELADFLEEHSGEDSLLDSVRNDRGNVVAGMLKLRLKEIRYSPDDADERAALQRYQKLSGAEEKLKKDAKALRERFEKQVWEQYAALSEADIKAIALGDKWFADIGAAIEHEVERLTQGLAGRIAELEERYAAPLHSLELEVEKLGAKVAAHLQNMGVEW